MGSGNGDGVGVGVGSYASSSGHGLSMAWQGQTASSHAAPAQRDMDSFAWASSVPQSAASAGASSGSRGGSLPPPPPPPLPPPAAAGFERFPADSGVLERSGGSSDSKRRRRSEEVNGTEVKPSNKPSQSADETKRSSKDANGGTAAAGESKGKEGYVHIRARSGQATNSHSLAEKLRREKISERMKLLQDLVPGCSKVTGKAVMLDEIINYVQSLQRQVEFLSMKLSTVNPRLDRSIESLITEHILPFPWPPSTAPIGFSFSQEMMPKPFQSGMIQGGVHGMANPDVFRTVAQVQLNESAAFGESSSQIHHALDGSSFHDTPQMAWPDQDGFHHM